MKHGIKQISVPKPCTQRWADMAIVDQGRYCQSCRKTVTDFSRLTNNQILAIVSSASNICGKFDDRQLTILNTTLNADVAQTSRFSWKKFSIAAAAFMGFLSFKKLEAKAKPFVEHHPVSFKEPVNTITDTIKEFRVITGSVADSLGEVLPGVIIRIKGTQFKATTDQYGQFRLTIPASPQLTAQVLYIGFITQEFKIYPQISKYSFVLKEAHSFMGEVVILPVKQPLSKKRN